jgi:nitrite reductase (NADH) small subunit
MPTWTRLASRHELPANEKTKEFEINGKVICVAAVDGGYAAMDNVCLHQGGALGQGVALDGKVICPWHAWRWDPITGVSVEDPTLKIAIYPLKIEGDDVLVEI